MRQRPYGLCHDPRTHPFSAESISERGLLLWSLRKIRKDFMWGIKTGRHPSCFSAIASSARGRPLFKPDARKTGTGPRFGEDALLNFRELIAGAGRALRQLTAFAHADFRAAVRTTVSSSAGRIARLVYVRHQVISFCGYYAAQSSALSACPLVKKRKR